MLIFAILFQVIHLTQGQGLSYNQILFPGTHNSYSNLWNPTPPPAPSYKKEILNQQWSIQDQLNKGIQVLDIELNSVPASKRASVNNNTFIVSHGTAEEAITFQLGYSYLEDILQDIKSWIPNHSFTPITLILNKQDSSIENREILKIFDKINITQYVYLFDLNITQWPTISQMNETNKPLMVFGLNTKRRFIKYQNWFITENCIPYNSRHNNPTPTPTPSTQPTQTHCIDQGWDGYEIKNFLSHNLIIPDTCNDLSCLFILYVLVSPRNLVDLPFIFGGNPLTQQKANTYDILYNLTYSANQILKKKNQQVNWLLVDFFDTTYNNNNISQWNNNPKDDLIRVVNDMNRQYHQSSKSCSYFPSKQAEQ